MSLGITWNAHCHSIIAGECALGNPNEGCEQLGGNQCMNHYRG